MPKDTRLGSVENCFCASCASLVCSSLHSLIWTISQFAELNIKGVLTLNNWPQNRLLEQFILFYQLGKFRGQRCSELVSVVGFHRTCVQSRVATEVMLNGKMLGILHVMLSHIQKGEVRCSFKCIGFRGCRRIAKKLFHPPPRCARVVVQTPTWHWVTVGLQKYLC